MLTHIHIRAFTIVEHIELEFGKGMTVLTGETGAGKSILIDALNLALGDRADSGIIRHGCERAEITAGFDIAALDAAQEWLKAHDFASEHECLLRRTISQEGRSKGYINGNPATMQALQELGELLVDIHGQHEHQSLLRADMQRRLLDDYAKHVPLLNELASVYQRWKQARHDLQTLSRAATDRNARLELLSYQVQELEALNLNESELEKINEEHARLANTSRLLETCQGALQALSEDEQASVLGLLSQSSRELVVLQEFDKRLTTTTELLNSAVIQAQEGVSELRRYLDSLESDPARLHVLEQRLASIHDLARKHRLAAQDLPKHLTQLAHELAELKNASVHLETLQTEIAETEKHYQLLAQRLTQSRKKAAHELAKQVSANMQQLSMVGGHFEVKLEPLSGEQFSAYGMERVEFLVSANPGQPLKPLAKVASGGELSRISLAIQVITAQSGRIPTLIFDEVDVGIGGGVAEIVGQQLRSLSQSRQVLCVTHLPQVAAQGQHHIQVSKHTSKGVTHITINDLTATERRDEIARMLGGVKITEQTKAHAAEMLASGQVNEGTPGKRKA